ncbi:MAG: hypothetical protein D4R72_03260 [Nitrosopumilales archaeon]|nr:MAG: hypothetical protein D4R72_03260 [Nitrosopumilales archaeon]
MMVRYNEKVHRNWHIAAVAVFSAFVIGQNVGSFTFEHNDSANMLHWPNIHENVKTDFNSAINSPQIKDEIFIHPFAIVIGDCHIGKMVLMAPTTVCRGDEGTPLYIGDYSNIQDGVILHALETTINEQNIDGRRGLETARSSP